MADSTERKARKEEYRKENTKSVNTRFFPTDMPLYEYIRSQPEGMAPYMKRLIREDMERNGIEYVPNPSRSHTWQSERKEA